MKCFFAANSPSRRRGLSIVELMIALTISLIVLVVMMQAFRRASGEIKKGRAMIEMASEMRAVGETFRRDMANATVSPRLWNLNSECNGYFEIIEGPNNDATYPAAPATYPGMSFFGDTDDIIAMTVRSGEKPFRGRYVDTLGATQIVESHIAEVIWFVFHEDVDENDLVADMDDRVTLYRRVLLVRPDLVITETAANSRTYYLNNDVSVRPVGANLVANTLADLTLRENRYAHNATAFPFEIQRTLLADVNPTLDYRLLTGEDIMLTNVAGFDIRVYSPNGPTKTPNDSQFLGPSDPNYATNGASPTDEGSYVDLGWSGAATGTSWFEEVSRVGTPSFWCSWSPHYEYNGIDDDLRYGIVDEGTNGLDDDSDGIVDEEDERDTQAPDAQPLRAVELTMRGIEKSTRNIRQVTITSSFVPE